MFIYFYIYGSVPLTLLLVGSDGALSTLCYSCKFDYQQGILKTLTGPGHLCSKDNVV